MKKGEVRGHGVDADANSIVVNVLPAMPSVSKSILDKHKKDWLTHFGFLWEFGGQVFKGGDTTLIMDSLPALVEEISQPRYQVVMETHMYGVGDNNSVVYKTKGFPKVSRTIASKVFCSSR